MAPLEETRPTGHGRARGLVSSRVSGRRIDARSFAPPPSLEPLVASFWVGRWDLPPDAPHTTRLLGDPCVHVIVSCGDGDAPPQRVVGVWTRLWENTLRGRGVVRGVKLRAGAAGALVPDASQLRDRVTSLDALFDEPPPIDAIGWSPEADETAFGAITTWLDRHLTPTAHTRVAVDACARIARDAELLRVADLVAALGTTERALQRIFRTQVGASPKWVIRRQRLQEAAVRMERGDSPSLTDLAHDLGYADQAHFARDWKAATDVPASRFAREVHQ